MGNQGFTLVEALISMILSTLVIALVTTTFLVQNDFYADVVKRTSLQENVRTAIREVSTALRGVAGGGVTAAEADSIAFRIPIAVGGVCAVSGTETYVLFPMDGDTVEAAEVVGYGVLDSSTGEWSHTTATWASVYHSSGATPAATCYAAGADTVGARNEFYRLDGLVASPALAVGDLVMVYKEREFRLATSALDSVTTAVFTGQAGGTLAEFANSLAPSSAFQYRLSGSTNFQDRVTGGNLSNIVAVRFSARGSLPSSRAGKDSLSYDLTVMVPLGNAY